MKILEVCPDFPPWAGSGAAETFRLLAQSWHDLGHEVTVVCSRPTARAGAVPADTPYRVECYRLIDLPASLHEASYFAPMRWDDRRRFHELVRREGGEFDRVIVHGLLETVPRTFLSWSRGALTSKLVSLQYGISTAEYSRLLRTASRILHMTLGRRLVSRMRTIVVFSAESGSELREYFGTPKGATVVRRSLGIDAAAFASEWAAVAQPPSVLTQRLAGRGIRSPFVFAIGRNHRAKGFDILLEAFAPLAREFPDLTLVLAGERTPFTEELERSIVAHGLEHRVLLLGRVSSPDRMALLAACTVFAIPSRKEGFGLNAAHARILSKPTVATSTGAHIETLDGEGPFWIVPPGDAVRLREALREGLQRPSGVSTIDATQLARFDIQSVAEGLLRLPEENSGSDSKLPRTIRPATGAP